MKIILDTNSIISYFLRESSVPGQAVKLAFRKFRVIASAEILAEYESVIAREKFRNYGSAEDRRIFIEAIKTACIIIPITSKIDACRDANDNKFLELANDGAADYIITGDNDLLDMKFFAGAKIITPADFVDLNL